MMYLANIRSESLLLQHEEFGDAAAVLVKRDFITGWFSVCLKMNMSCLNPTFISPLQYKHYRRFCTVYDCIC